jgi:alkaline phosphatase D
MADSDEHGKTGAFGALTRREALQLTLAAGISATTITFAVTAEAAAKDTVFLHGIASGDPLTDRVVLWTRVTLLDPAAAIPVKWTVAEDRQMRRVVRRGRSNARQQNDYTVKIDVDGLAPGTTYYYRFEATGKRSPVGRTRTLPRGDVGRLKLAVFSCSNFELGYFNAYAEASKHDDLDAVLHLGDYIYEYGPGDDGYTTPAAALGLVPKPRDSALLPAEEIVVLDQYRARHALYRTDAHLQALHRDNPFINIWDDHELANDAWTSGAENHEPDEEGRWIARKKAGVRAFYEWLPIREPKDGDRIDPVSNRPDEVYRVFDFGDLTRLVMIDTRHAGRNLQLDTPALVATYAAAAPQGPFEADLNDRGRPRTLLGTEQEEWLAKKLAATKQTWQLIGNQVLMFYQNAPDINGTALLNDEQRAQFIGLLDQLFGPGFGAQLAQLGAAGLPFPLAADAWTGYPTARLKMLDLLATASNPIVLTGDSHNAWTANLLRPTDSDPLPVGAEFGCTSVSSPGYEQYLLDVPPELVAALFVDSSARKSPGDQLIYAECARRGFLVIEITPEEAIVDHVFLSSAFEDTYTTETKRFRVLAGSREAEAVA